VVVNLSGSTWTPGRNKLWRAALQQELVRGRLYEYVSMWDEDVFLFGHCDLQPSEALLAGQPLPESLAAQPMPEPAAGRSSTCYRQLEAWLLALLPPLAAPAYWPSPGNCIEPSRAFTRVWWMDAESIYLHRRAADSLLPYDEFLEAYSAWPSQVRLLQQASRYYGHVVNFNHIVAANQLHRDYKRGSSAGQPCTWGLEHMLEELSPPPSLLHLNRWTCTPCAIQDSELPQALQQPAAPGSAAGSLQWLDSEGLAPWPVRLAEVQAAGLCSEEEGGEEREEGLRCAGAGLLGTAPLKSEGLPKLRLQPLLQL
jgi:hypothetical protein